MREPATAAMPYGGQGLALLRALAARGSPTFSMDQARESAREAGVRPSYLPVLLHRLERSGWLRRVKHGTYALTAGLPGFPEAHPFVIAMALVEPCAISGWSALHHHGLTEQIPHAVTLTTPKRVVTPAMRGAVRAAPSTWEVAGQRYEIVVVVAARFFGYDETWMGDARARIFDRERALLDCFALPRRFGGLAEGLGILEERLGEVDAKRLVAHALRYGKDVVAKRIGFALERVGVAADVVEPLRALPMRGFRALDPGRAPRGTRIQRWGLIDNLASPRNHSRRRRRR